MSTPPSRYDAVEFRTSSFCGISGCVEVAKLPGGDIVIRDSKIAASPVLSFTGEEWDAFVRGVKNGEFD